MKNAPAGQLAEVVAPPGSFYAQPESPAPDTFRLLVAGLRRRGIDTTGFHRSTPLQPLLHRYAVEITEEVALVNPCALPPFVHRENLCSRLGLNLVLLALAATIGLAIAHSPLAFVTAGGVLLGCALVQRGEAMPPRPMTLKGLHTLGDLARRMETREAASRQWVNKSLGH